MKLLLREGEFDHGAYGYVVRTSSARAVKIFRKDASRSESHVRQVFYAEAEAYEIASNVPNLKALIPEFFGRVVVDSVCFGEEDLSSHFYLDYAFEMEWVDGYFHKLGVLPSEVSGEVKRLFLDAGIAYVKDASAVVSESGKVECVIDFAVREY